MSKYLSEAVPLEDLTYTGGRLNPVLLAANAMPLLATSNSYVEVIVSCKSLQIHNSLRNRFINAKMNSCSVKKYFMANLFFPWFYPL